MSTHTPRGQGMLVMACLLLLAGRAQAQLDPINRSMIHVGYDQSFNGQGPQAAYLFYYYNDPDFLSTNKTLRLVLAPVYLDGELGFRELLSPNTDFGIGLNAQRDGNDGPHSVGLLFQYDFKARQRAQAASGQ